MTISASKFKAIADQLSKVATTEMTAKQIRLKAIETCIKNDVKHPDQLKVNTAKNDPTNPLSVDQIHKLTDIMFLASYPDEHDQKLIKMAHDDPRMDTADIERRKTLQKARGTAMKDFGKAFQAYLNKQSGKGAGGSRTAGAFADRHKKASADMTKAITAVEKSNSNDQQASYDPEIIADYIAMLSGFDKLAKAVEDSKILPIEE